MLVIVSLFIADITQVIRSNCSAGRCRSSFDATKTIQIIVRSVMILLLILLQASAVL